METEDKAIIIILIGLGTLFTIMFFVFIQPSGITLDKCKELFDPSTSIENQTKFNHCYSYPETYGVKP